MQDRPAWSAAELATAVGMTADSLRKRALFWISHGVLQETRTPAGMVGRSPLLQSSLLLEWRRPNLGAWMYPACCICKHGPCVQCTSASPNISSGLLTH